MKKLFALIVISFIGTLAYAQMTCTISMVTNPSCSAGCNGSATVSATGGVPPYNIIWQPGNISGPTISNMCAGSYTCTVTDNNATTCSSTVTLVAPPALTITTVPTSAFVCVGGAVNFSVMATGGTPPYTYSWSFPGGSPSVAATQNPSITYNSVGSYTAIVTVTDANGCVASSNIPVTVSPTSVGGSVSSSATVCSGSNGALVLSGHTGTVIRWEMSIDGGLTWTNISNTSTTQLFTNITVSTIYRAVVQSGSCPLTYSSWATITVSSNPTATINGQWPTCNNADGWATVTPGGNAPFTYSWVPTGGNNATATNLMAGTYSVVVTDASGCTVMPSITLQDSCDYVWPGDANDDAVADNVDILDIGIANGATGTTRANASLTWIGQPSTAWGQTLLSGTDYKWVDCNGDGAINPTDTQAVVLNFGMTHNNRLVSPSYTLAAPALAISFDQDSLAAGDVGTITLSFGDTADPANNIYGIGFRLNFDAVQMVTSSFGITGGTTWIGTPGGDLMRVVLRPSPANGSVDVAITRLDHQDVSGNGMIGKIYYTASMAMSGTGNGVLVPMNITNLVVVNALGQPQPANVINDSIVIADSAIITQVSHHAQQMFAVYPNPADENLQINITGNENQLVVIEDLSGRVVYSQVHPAGVSAIATSVLPSGTYLMRVGNGRNSHVEKITIAH